MFQSLERWIILGVSR